MKQSSYQKPITQLRRYTFVLLLASITLSTSLAHASGASALLTPLQEDRSKMGELVSFAEDVLVTDIKELTTVKVHNAALFGNFSDRDVSVQLTAVAAWRRDNPDQVRKAIRIRAIGLFEGDFVDYGRVFDVYIDEDELSRFITFFDSSKQSLSSFTNSNGIRRRFSLNSRSGMTVALERQSEKIELKFAIFDHDIFLQDPQTQAVDKAFREGKTWLDSHRVPAS